MRWLRLTTSVLVALLPSWLKVRLYRLLFRYQIGKGVHIGLSPFVGVQRCRIGDNVRIGSFNLFYRIDDLDIGPHVEIGFGNLFRGGRAVRLGAYATILRLNTLNAILQRDFVNEVEPVLDLGTGVVITSGHWLDFSAGLRVGAHAIIGGRNSSFWTHNRQRGRPITVGCHTYLGSEIRLAPGVEVPPFAIVALGAVLMGKYTEPRSLIAGNPATVLRPLDSRDLFLVARKTRNDIPDDIARALLPDDLRRLLDEYTSQERGPS